MLILSTNVDKKSLETEFSIADWRQMAIENTVFLAIFINVC